MFGQKNFTINRNENCNSIRLMIKEQGAGQFVASTLGYLFKLNISPKNKKLYSFMKNLSQIDLIPNSSHVESGSSGSEKVIVYPQSNREHFVLISTKSGRAMLRNVRFANFTFVEGMMEVYRGHEVVINSMIQQINSYLSEGLELESGKRSKISILGEQYESEYTKAFNERHNVKRNEYILLLTVIRYSYFQNLLVIRKENLRFC